MIAKAKAIAHGQQAINYALREGKMGKFLASNLISSEKPDEILQEFEMMQRYNDRCKNKFLRFEIGIAPQDEAKLKHADLQTICRQFAKSMVCLHSQRYRQSSYSSDCKPDKSGWCGLSNRFHQQSCRESSRRVKKRLQDVAYMELRNTNNKTPKQFIDALKRQGVSVEPVRNKQDKIYGIRFQFEGQTFKASEIGKEFGLRSLFHHYGQNIGEKSIQAKHFEKPHISDTANNGWLISGLISAITPSSDSEYDQDEAQFQKQFQIGKKKKRRSLSM